MCQYRCIILWKVQCLPKHLAYTINILSLSCGLPELQCALHTNKPLLDLVLQLCMNLQAQIYWISQQSVVAFICC